MQIGMVSQSGGQTGCWIVKRPDSASDGRRHRMLLRVFSHRLSFLLFHGARIAWRTSAAAWSRDSIGLCDRVVQQRRSGPSRADRAFTSPKHVFWANLQVAIEERVSRVTMPVIPAEGRRGFGNPSFDDPDCSRPKPVRRPISSLRAVTAIRPSCDVHFARDRAPHSPSQLSRLR